MRIRRFPVSNLLEAGPRSTVGSRLVGWPCGHPMIGVLMADLVFVALTVAFFALAALMLRGVERL